MMGEDIFQRLSPKDVTQLLLSCAMGKNSSHISHKIEHFLIEKTEEDIVNFQICITQCSVFLNIYFVFHFNRQQSHHNILNPNHFPSLDMKDLIFYIHNANLFTQIKISRAVETTFS